MTKGKKELWGPYYITEEYRVIADKYCYHLERRRITKDGDNKGNIYWVAEGYYPNIHRLLEKLLDLQITENLENLNKAVERMGEVEKNLDKLVKLKCEREKSWMS